MLAAILPERKLPTYHAEAGAMTVKATMAGMAGMDSPYPPGGHVETSTFLEQTVKLAQTTTMPEAALRRLQTLWQSMFAAGQPTNDMLLREALNFLDKVVIQPHVDTAEWLRGQALTLGALSWRFNAIQLDVDYGIPPDHLFPERTADSGYGGSASVFWADVIQARRLLRYQSMIAVAHPDTVDVIISNSANTLRVIDQTDRVITVQRYVGTTEQLDSDARYRLSIYLHGLEGDVIDPASPTEVNAVPFFPTGYVSFIANSGYNRSYRVGMGSTIDPAADMALGYTHIAPTVEGNGLPGRWADLGTPDERPWELRGRGVSNVLPVIENPDKLVVLHTEMP
jgi:hypothetical protein